MDRSSLLATVDKFDSDLQRLGANIAAGLASVRADLASFRTAVDALPMFDPQRVVDARLSPGDLEALADRVAALVGRPNSEAQLDAEALDEPFGIGRLEHVAATALERESPPEPMPLTEEEYRLAGGYELGLEPTTLEPVPAVIGRLEHVAATAALAEGLNEPAEPPFELEPVSGASSPEPLPGKTDTVPTSENPGEIGPTDLDSGKLNSDV